MQKYNPTSSTRHIYNSTSTGRALKLVMYTINAGVDDSDAVYTNFVFVLGFLRTLKHQILGHLVS